jgi:hypothetical protein
MATRIDNTSTLKEARPGGYELVPGNIVTGIEYYGADTECIYIGFYKDEVAKQIKKLYFASTEPIMKAYDQPWRYKGRKTRFYRLPALNAERFDQLNGMQIVDSTLLNDRTDLYAE